MKKSSKIILLFGLLAILTAAIVISVNAVSGAAFTTYNPWVDGDFKEVCKNSIINCNIYGAKPDVWLNGGPSANGLGPDGEYFFAVLVPGGQPDPNDGGAKNLSDDYDCYFNRTFTVTDGEVSAYTGSDCGESYDFRDPHDLDSGDFLDPSRKTCHKPRGCEPDGEPPLIRLYPYADTWNPGGVYILAICSLDEGYPVEPRDCKYDAFKVKEGPATATLKLAGMKFEDVYADGKDDWEEFVYMDPGLEGWEIHIYGTGFLNDPIDEYRYTDANGFWDDFQIDYQYNKQTDLVPAELTVCETPQEGWTQSYPGTVCYYLAIEPASLAERLDLDFGNWQPIDVTACKNRQNYDGSTTPVEGWMVSLTVGGTTPPTIVDTQPTGSNGCYTWSDLTPGIVYDVHEEDKAGWLALGPVDFVFERAKSGESYSHTFVNQPLEGCTPGFWQGGNGFETAGGKWYWNIDDDPDWAGLYDQPFSWLTPFDAVFSGSSETMWHFINPEMWEINDDFHKAARSLVAAYLNASWGIGYPYTTGELEALWADAYANGTLLALHTELDAANNAYYRAEPPAHCPISASIP